MAAYKHINANGNFQLQKGPTQLGQVVVNDAGTAWVLTIYDGLDASGAVVAVIKEVAGGNYEYECMLSKGLFVVTSGTTAGDITIMFE